MTKLVTCSAAMRLIEQGKLSLEDPVYKYLPTYEHMMVKENGILRPAQTTITIRHLMSMRSGLSYDLESPALLEARKNPMATTHDLMLALGNDPLHFEPGSRYFYSLSHDVLGAVIEVVTGLSLGDALKSLIFDPLEMEDITFWPNEEQKSRLTQLYFYNYMDYTTTPVETVRPNMSSAYESGGGGLCGTNDQYMKLVDALANNGEGHNGYRILKPETIAMMKVNHMNADDMLRFSGGKPGYGYGLGVRTLVDPVMAEGPSPIGEFGWDGAASSYSLVDTDNQLAIVFTTHVRPSRPLFRETHPRLRNLAYIGIGK